MKKGIEKKVVAATAKMAEKAGKSTSMFCYYFLHQPKAPKAVLDMRAK